jgi:rhodanese-related sulfurtransferase
LQRIFTKEATMNSISTKIVISLPTALCMLFLAQQLHAVEEMDVIQAQNMKKQGDYSLDLRESGEIAVAHRPDAAQLPPGKTSSRRQEIVANKYKAFVMMCRSSRRTAQEVNDLQSVNLNHVKKVKEGIQAREKTVVDAIPNHAPISPTQ